MALIVSAASGNFNSTATWVGGVIPTTGDEARASTGHTVTITANTTCTEISNDGTGTFVLNGGVTLNARLTHKSATTAVNLLSFSANSPNASIINGDVYGITNSAMPIIHANASAVRIFGTGTLTINGNVFAGAITNNQGFNGAVNVGAAAVLNINGNVTGLSATNELAVFIFSNSAVVNIVGTVTGGNASSSTAVVQQSNGTVNITGNCYGGTGGVAFSNSSTGTVNITGDLYGGAGAGAAALTNNNVAIVTGSLYASEFAPAISGGARTQTTRLRGPFYTSPINGVNPNTATAWRWDSTLNPNTFIQVPTNNLASLRNFVTPDNATNFPPASDVRSGITYGIEGALTGTCVIPPAASVKAGVSVDNTVGTAALSAADLWSYSLSSASSVAGSVGEKLKKTAIPADIIALG